MSKYPFFILIKFVQQSFKFYLFLGQYSVIEPDGSMRSVRYSAGPTTGFTAEVNNEGAQIQASAEGRDLMEDKVLRDYKHFDFPDDPALEYNANDRKRRRHPYESLFRDYELKKRLKYPTDQESSDYTHSITIKHPHEDDADSLLAAESHVGFNFDPNCKKKRNKDSNNSFLKTSDFDFRKQKFPSITDDKYKSEFEKYLSDSSNMEKVLQMYKNNEKYKPFKEEDDEFENWSGIKYNYHSIPDIPPENLFSDYSPPRPKKKSKPHKKPEFLDSEDLDDFILVPKKKHKKPPRFAEPPEYHGPDEEFDDSYDEDYYKPPRNPPQKEIVRKIVKKKKPVINLLDIFDI